MTQVMDCELVLSPCTDVSQPVPVLGHHVLVELFFSIICSKKLVLVKGPDSDLPFSAKPSVWFGLLKFDFSSFVVFPNLCLVMI